MTALPRRRADVFAAPILRGLDATSRRAALAAGRASALAPGARLYREGDPGESFYVVTAGEVELIARRRGEAEARRLRTACLGDSFGEEATLPGLARRASARAGSEGAEVFEIPVAVFRRAVGRAGGGAADRERRYLERSALADLLGASALGRRLEAAELEPLLDAAQVARHRRGERLYEAGDPGGDWFVVLGGLVQIQREHQGRTAVQAYLTGGDFFGDEEALSGAPRAASAVAMGDTWCARIPGAALAALAHSRPALLDEARRVAGARRREQAQILDDAAMRTTRHVFRDVYRMQMAQSLLVIDQDRCVRCGHCAWSCAQVHDGTSRLVRRGDQMVARVTPIDAARARTLLVPNSCQHCKNAACMIDCPTGAIGRDLDGEVFIRPELCTGCGACAKACPWENIHLAPRESGSDPQLSPEIAVKCDLCRERGEPACVQACPTEAIWRLDPQRDVAELGELLGTGRAERGVAARQPLAALAWGVAAAACVAVAGAGLGLRRAGVLSPGRGLGLAAGIVAALLLVGLAGYAVPKRLARLLPRRLHDIMQHFLRPQAASRQGSGLGRLHDIMQHFLRPQAASRQRGALPRSRTRRMFLLHLGLGGAALAAAASHAGPHLPGSAAGALYLAFLASSLLGAFGALAYAVVPPALTRLERRGALPEDLAGEKDALLDRLYRGSSGKSELLKAVADKVLVPYARAPLGGLRLLLSGRDLGAERRRLRRHIDAVLEGRGSGRLAGLDALIDTVVELRALPARRRLTALLRVWLPLHIFASAAALGLLALHVWGALR